MKKPTAKKPIIPKVKKGELPSNAIPDGVVQNGIPVPPAKLKEKTWFERWFW